MSYGITVKQDTGGSRVEVQCKHQSGLLYVVPAEASWVCSAELAHAHALAGMMKELSQLQGRGVQQIMQKWGVYYRELPLQKANEET